jgi:5-oxoprolinase (ATP-hydrolysing) subunit A
MDIDLNADLAEGFGPWTMGDDNALLEVLTSPNLACGFHAGDPLIMRRTAELAQARGVDIGAHVGFPDIQGFGRRIMQIDPSELAAMVVYQLGALAGIARSVGARMTHMSFHGALGNMVAADHALAAVLVKAVADFDAGLIISSSSSLAIESAAAANGLKVATTFLADRAYGDDGLLVPRKLPNSVLHDEAVVLERVRRLLGAGEVVTYTGHILPMRPHSILLHGDTEGAVGMARQIRREIEASGHRVVPISRQFQ